LPAFASIGVDAVLTCGDANNDNTVGLTDLAHVLLDYMQTGPSMGDLDGDQCVSLVDLALVLLGFGEKGDGY
jgi:hypothetical protein